ncbi:type II toxin-antitoxin system CcdA family antitoxin [Pyrodictium abyssi]|uniref:Type II toxin-antitoxin system CcdA family antitoxin n=1 Tax=Pyrodictium abyssi TaxID=54256 RepID=A0ABM8IW11_9CREN|nr:type II toxin-antitoxin system CcdA family antitoxin [Pyrodictium abyssi]
MESYVTVSTRIRKELWDKLRKYRIDVSEVINRALEEEVAKREEEEVKKMLERAGKILEKVPEERIVETIRSMREER